MTDRSDSKSRARPPLSRERVLSAAIEVADEVGVESLTMRRLGTHLGVEAMSLYKHVADKDEILDGIVDRVFGEIELPAANVDWRTAMRQRAFSARQVLAGHPWAIGMLESRTRMGPQSLSYVDAVIGSLRGGGFSVAMAAHAFFLLDSYIYGFVVQETSMAFETGEGAGAGGLPADGYPHLAEMVDGYVAESGNPYDHEFEFGLELILDGLEAQRAG